MSSQWTQYTNDEGYDYWYNETTGESTWDNPSRMMEAVMAALKSPEA